MSQILDKLTFNLLGDEYVLRSTETLATTYSDLKSKRDHSELIPGMWYRITDYRTTTTLENTSSAYHPFEILVQALTENTLSEDAKAYVKKYELLSIDSLELYYDGEYIGTEENTYKMGSGYFSYNWGPGGNIDLSIANNYVVDDYGLCIVDKSEVFKFYFKPELEYIYINNHKYANNAYFNNSNLSAWEIKYCLDNDTARFTWADPDGYGVIYYLKDEFGNEANFDFKNLQKNGKYIFDVDGEDGSLTGPVNIINGVCAHAEGYYTIANNDTEHAQGSYNKSNATTLHSVGIGTSESDRKNAFEIANDGKVYIKDVGGYDGTNPSDENDVVSALKNVGSSIIHVTYDELVDLQSLSKLIPGQQYRITDYVTKTSTSYTYSTGYAFDIIVLAVSSNTLSEDAKACLCTYNLLIDVIDENGDVCTAVGLQSLLTGRVQYQTPTGSYFTILWFTKNKWRSPFEIKGSDNKVYLSADAKRIYSYLYFTNSKLEAWEIKYSLKNTTTRFAWADTTNGKGVIYYMKDEFGNEAPYDFKNIQFKPTFVRNSFTSSSVADQLNYIELANITGNGFGTVVTSNIIETKADFYYTFTNGNNEDASKSGLCHDNIIESYYDTDDTYNLPNIVITSSTGQIHGNKFLQCSHDIYARGVQFTHNIFDGGCDHVVIEGIGSGSFYDNYITSAYNVILAHENMWDNRLFSLNHSILYSSSHVKNNHFLGLNSGFKFLVGSFQNVHVLGYVDHVTVLPTLDLAANNKTSYLLACVFHPYTSNIQITGFKWLEKAIFLGAANLHLQAPDYTKNYGNIIVYPGDYTDVGMITEIPLNSDPLCEIKRNNSTTIMI